MKAFLKGLYESRQGDCKKRITLVFGPRDDCFSVALHVSSEQKPCITQGCQMESYQAFQVPSFTGVDLLASN
jgi:hypothetical protein